MSETLYVQMSKILDEYDEHVKEVTDEAIKEVARNTVDILKATSPRRKVRGGTYAGGWALKSVPGSGNIKAVTVYNRRAPGLTHLLEYGHAVVPSPKHPGKKSRVAGNPHIKQAEERANQELEDEIRRRLE